VNPEVRYENPDYLVRMPDARLGVRGDGIAEVPLIVPPK
jgi:hypothetical protein